VRTFPPSLARLSTGRPKGLHYNYNKGMRRFLLCLSLLVLIPTAATGATVDGLKLHSSSAGQGSKTIILVHGWTCDDTSWSEQVPVLAKTFRVVTLDLPGHGRSDSPRDGKFSMDLFARAVEAVRSEAKADKVVLVGHSMGTPVIRQYARLYPQHVAALVLVDGLVFMPAASAGAAAPPLQPSQLSGPEGLKARENMIKTMFTPATPQALQQTVLKMMLGAPEATASGAMLATFDAANWKDDVMSMPVLGIYAEKSQLGNQEYSKKIFPAFDYVEIPGTGHFVMMEKPAEFNRLLTTFLNKINY
jgi:pimeloyl-ACP methyl ester carboxylesterase